MVERGRAGELYDIKIQHLHIEGVVDYGNPEFEGIFEAQQFLLVQIFVNKLRLVMPITSRFS